MDCLVFETSTYGSALRLEGEAYQTLRHSRSAKNILLLCLYFPFSHLTIALDILSSRRTENHWTNVDKLELHKADESLKKTATECDSCSWNWQWSPPFVSSIMGPSEAANDTDNALLKLASRVTFVALARKACGLQSRAVEDVFYSIDNARLLLDHRFNSLGVSKKEYESVEKKLENPLSCWIFSNSLRNTGGTPVPSEAMASILNPIRGLFESRELPLMSLLQRLQYFDVLYQDVLAGVDPRWECLREADFWFLECLHEQTPQNLAELLTTRDLAYSQKFCPNDFLQPTELRRKSPQWSNLVHTVRVCAKAQPDLIRFVDEAAKILLNQGNFFSGMALIYGLCGANHPPAGLLWHHFTVRHICMAYQAKAWLLRLFPYTKVDAASKLTGAETKSVRSCMGSLSKFLSLPSAILFGTQQNTNSQAHNSEVPSEHNEERGRQQVDSMAGSEVELIVLSRSRNPSQHVNDMSHMDDHSNTETVIGRDSYDDSDFDSAIGFNRIVVHGRKPTPNIFLDLES